MADKELFGNSEQQDCSDCVNHGGDWDCDHVHCRKGTDTISRQAAMDELERGKDKKAIGAVGEFYNQIIDNDIEKLRRLPSAQPKEDIRAMCGECDAWNQYKNYPQPEWIPCCERLPKDEEEVIVSIHDDSCDNALDYSSSGWYAPAGDFWVVENEVNSRVIAWMPLPKPWEGR